jgi:hypothetical protein
MTTSSVARSAKEALSYARSEDDVMRAARQATAIADPPTRMDVLGDAAVKFSDRGIVEAAEHALTPFEDYLEPNPRSIKLFVNSYGVLRSLRTLEEIFVPSGPLALWTVVETRWPHLADLLRAHPDAITNEATDKVARTRSIASDRTVRLLGFS